jgi:multisubunit Na+/H+ antiporter MnhF subunit
MILILCHLLLAAALVLSAWRLFRGPTAADRVLAIDLLAVITASAVLLHAIRAKEPVFIDILVGLGVIVFFGTVALARTLGRDN